MKKILQGVPVFVKWVGVIYSGVSMWGIGNGGRGLLEIELGLEMGYFVFLFLFTAGRGGALEVSESHHVSEYQHILEVSEYHHVSEYQHHTDCQHLIMCQNINTLLAVRISTPHMSSHHYGMADLCQNINT